MWEKARKGKGYGEVGAARLSAPALCDWHVPKAWLLGDCFLLEHNG